MKTRRVKRVRRIRSETGRLSGPLPVSRQKFLVLDMGCGPAKTPGAVGVDILPFDGVDVRWDLNRFPYPFPSDSADRVLFTHSLEHVDDVFACMNETLRILKPGGRVTVSTPHFSSMNAYSDFTHKHVFSLHAFRGMCCSDVHAEADPRTVYRDALIGGGIQQKNPEPRQKARFRFVDARFKFWRLHDAVAFVPAKCLGVEWASRRFPVFFERFLAFRFPASEFTVTLEAVKE